MGFRLQVRNYRGLRAVDWSPEGVCALVGANGSGKTTLLDVLALLGDALQRGLARALEAHGGAANAQNLYANEPYRFAVSLDDVVWSLEPLLATTGYRSAESVTVGGKLVAAREPGANAATIAGKPEQLDEMLMLGAAFDELSELEALYRAIHRFRLYAQYDLAALRRSGSPDSSDRVLDQRGSNAFSVLRNWRDTKAGRERYTFVTDGLREVFSDFFEDLEFEKAAQVIGANLVLKGDRTISASLAPDGWFTALLHLTALASSEREGIVAIDEPENALHPHAIRLLLGRMRSWARRHDVTVLLATHSPVIISDFDTRPEQLFVMQPDEPVQPVPVTQLKSREWLAHFTLGDLYMREEFGAPQDDAESRADHHG